jgi:hypothetical protein
MTEREDELITIDDDGKRAFAVCTMPNGYEIRERIPRHVLKMNMEDKQWHLTLIAKELQRRTSLFRMLAPGRPMSGGDETMPQDTTNSPSENAQIGAEG